MNKQSFLLFSVAQKICALPLTSVEGVSDLPETVSIPGCQSRVIRGLAYVSGQLVFVVDLTPLLNQPPMDLAGKVLLVRHAQTYYAILTSAVGGIVTDPDVPKKFDDQAAFGARLRYRNKHASILNLEAMASKYALCR